MNRITYTTFLYAFFCFSLSSFAQEFAWLKNSTSTDIYTSHSFYASTQYEGDFYFSGDFWKDLIIDDFQIEIELSDANGFIVKMDENGKAKALWHFRSDDYVRINKLIVNPVSGNLIATGNFHKNLIFDDEEWTVDSGTKGFMMSINPDGTLDWMKEFEPQSNISFASGAGLAIDDQGNIFVGMEASGDLIIDSESFSFNQNYGACIIAKFSSNGELLGAEAWRAKTFEGWMDITDMTIDSDNQVVIVGSVIGTFEIANSDFVFSQTSHQPIIIKMDNDLNLQWLKTYEATNGHIRRIINDDKKLLISMQYFGSIDIDGELLIGSGSYGDMAIVLLDESAQLQWAKNFTLSENGGIAGVYGTSITSWLGEFYIAGMYQGDVVHEGVLILDNSNSGATYMYPFILSLDKDGELTSVYDFVGSNEPGKINGISSSKSHLLFGGDFSGKISVGDTSVTTLNSALFYGGLKTTVTGIAIEEAQSSLISIYPTLASSYINVSTELEVSNISLVTAAGVFVRDFSGDSKLIDINNLTSGTYYLIADLKGKLVSMKFVKL